LAYRQPRAVLLAACGLSAAGALLFNVAPAFLGAAGLRYSLSDEQIGWAGSSYGAGFALVAMTSFFWIARLNWRRLAMLSTAWAASSLVACALAPGVPILIAAMFCAGLGCGALYTVGNAVVSESHEPDRAYGVKLSIETFVGVALLVALPGLIAERWGFRGVGLAIASVASLCGLLALRSTPVRREAGVPPGDGGTTPSATTSTDHHWTSWLGLAALLMWFGGIAALWDFLGRIAPSFGLTGVITTRIVLAILVANALSGLAPAIIGDRWGRVPPLSVAMLLALVGVVVLASGHGPWRYATGALLTYGLLSLPLSYQMGLIASSDDTGRIASMIPAAMSLGGAIAPALAGSLLKGASYVPLYAFTAGTTVVSLTAFLLVARHLMRRTSTV
jgi:predicted MFS family arabinose efflux permease